MVKASEKVRRDDAIIADRAKGLAWPEVAQKHGISERQARKIWEDEKAERIPELKEEDALDVVHESLARYEQWQNQLAEITAETKGAVKVGAIKAQMNCEAEKIELRQATGLLPKNLGKLAVEWDVRFVVRQVVQVLEQHQVSSELERDLLKALNPGSEN